MPDEVEYLYHYTSIEKLALILKNRTIRLNPLDKMDDLQEQKTADVENIGKFVFISSWTSDVSESIPMWKMYTDPSSGVRIKLRKNPFVWHGTRGTELEKAIGIPAADEKSRNANVKTFLDLCHMINGGYFSPQGWGGDILTEVKYTNDINLLEPRVICNEDGKIGVNIGVLGKYKNLHWKFQKEWRYVMSFVSLNFKAGFETMEVLFAQSVQKMIQGKEPPPFRYFDLDIDSTCFEEMEITCSPQMSVGNKILLDTLVEKYNPSATIAESELLGKI